MKEVYIKIKGRVQGIGFRWFAVHEAKRIGGISGWVRNEADGSVEILMRGEEEKIETNNNQRERQRKEWSRYFKYSIKNSSIVSNIALVISIFSPFYYCSPAL